MSSQTKEVEPMNNCKSLFLMIILASSIVPISACGAITTQSTPTIEPPPVNMPLWTESDTDHSGQQLLIYANTLYQRPPFYDGPIPFDFTSAKKILAFNYLATVTDEFSEWKTIFIYNDPTLEFSGIATGARTFDKSGQLLAEARFEEIIKGTGIVILEIHYNKDGSARFWCESQIDFSTGFKTNETEAHGTKEKDYYFLWPVSNN